MRISELIIEFILQYGYDTFFLITGGAIAPMIDAIGTNISMPATSEKVWRALNKNNSTKEAA